MNIKIRNTIEVIMAASVISMLLYSIFALTLAQLTPPHAKLVVVGIATLGSIYFSTIYHTDDPWASRGIALSFGVGAIAALRSYHGDTSGGWVLIGAGGVVLWAWAAAYLGDEQALIVRWLRRRGAVQVAEHEKRKESD